MKMSYNKQERDTMQTKTNPYNLTPQELEIIHGAGWRESPFDDLPTKFCHSSMKDKDGSYKRLNGAEVLEIIKKNMQDTIREGLDY